MANAVSVFVSHNSADDTFTHQLVDDLRAAGADVWVDFGNVDRNDWVNEINQALQTHQWMVLVLTPAAVRAPWVQTEMSIGLVLLNQHRLRGILPLLAASMAQDEIPAIWSHLDRYDATRDYDLALRGILAAVGLRSDGAWQPDTITVDPEAQDGPRTIGEALALAAEHDRIKLWPGIYREALKIDKSVQLVGHGQAGEVILAPPPGRGLTVTAPKVRMANVTVWVGAPKDPQKVYAEAKMEAIGTRAAGTAGVAVGALVVAGAIAAHVVFPPAAIWTAGLALAKLVEMMGAKASAPHDIEALQVVQDASLELREVIVRNSAGAGIVARGQVEAYQCRIHKCKLSGCLVQGELKLEDSELGENTIGLFVTGEGRVSAFRNRILVLQRQLPCK